MERIHIRGKATSEPPAPGEEGAVLERHLRSLNPEQRRAVTRTEGPVLVLAGAGSGKTRMLVHRIVHLIRDSRTDPARIAVVTFTNKAANEMRERVRAYAGDEARRVTISTFHSLGVRILREHGSRLDLPKGFAIYGTADQLGALRTACSEISIDDDSFDLKRVLGRISDWKTRRITPAEAASDLEGRPARGDRRDDYDVLSVHAYAKYQEILRAAGAVDFDDLLLLPVRLLEENEDARRALWRRWHYLMIDEYQDTSPVQLELARHLSGTRRNLCVVGDDDQSIYAFRGADVGNILEFERHFPGAAVIALEQNYRSTQHILEAANAVIAANDRRHPKQLHTGNPRGAPIDFYEHDDELAEAEVVGKEIALRRFREQLDWGDFAVLYRTNTQARPVEEALREKGIPYRVIGGTSFFERKEIADAVAYLRLASNPRDEIALRRVINYPTRGIGRTTVLKIAGEAADAGSGFAEALADADADRVGSAQAASIEEFLALLRRSRLALARAELEARQSPDPRGLPPLAAWARRYFDDVGLENAIRDDRRTSKTADRRVDNLRDLIGSLARYERRRWKDAAGDPVPENWAPPTLADALTRLALSDLDEEDDDGGADDAVVLMTLHSAKGLEFSEVFLIGLEEEIIPHARALQDSGGATAAEGLAEERRLLYVGITRAKHRLTLSLCRTRRRGGERVETLPSRYLEEIPEELLNIKSADAVLSPEESKDLRQNFMRNMKDMLEEG